MTDRGVLLDAGVLVALVQRRDPQHEACVETWSRVRGRVWTVEGVLVETAHFVRRVPNGTATALGLVRAAGVEVVPPTDARYDRALALMDKYADVPMDLVDALLVALAEEVGTTEVLTLDRRGFGAYRIRGRTRFRIRP